MRCCVCGGEIHLNTPCSRCKITYPDMLEKISHPEIINLMNKIDYLQKHNLDNTLEASLLACELENSYLIVPAEIGEDNIRILKITEKGENFIPLFTDMDAFSDFTKFLFPLANSFDVILKLADSDVSGFVINVNRQNCTLLNSYLERFFKG